MLVCERCGAEYDDWDDVPHYEDRDYISGARFCRCETIYECSCGSDKIVEAKECAECGRYIPEDGPDLCEDCLNEKIHNKDLAFQYGTDNRDSIELNSFILHLFGNDTHKIEQVLKRVIEQDIVITDKDLESYWEGNEDALTDL